MLEYVVMTRKGHESALVQGDSCYAMFETYTTDLKDTFHAKQKLLEEMYKELEQEREDSLIVTGEALSRILSLQGRNAVLEMEVNEISPFIETCNSFIMALC